MFVMLISLRKPNGIYLIAFALRKDIAVEHAVVDRFLNMVRLDRFDLLQICNRSGYAQDFVVGASRQAHFRHGDSHQLTLLFA